MKSEPVNSPQSRLSLGRFVAYTAAGCGVVAIFLLSWELREVVLLAFGAIIVAVIIRALARPLVARAGIRERWAILLVVLGLIAAIVGASWLFGHQITSQLRELGERLPRAVEGARTWLEGTAVGQFAIEKMSGEAEDIEWFSGVHTFFTIGVATMGHALLMLFAGIYLASNPTVYVRGFVSLFPLRHRQKIEGALGESGAALRKWLLGQIVSMVTVGLLTGLGLWAVGAPLPLALGIMAGLLEFIPALGPVIAIIPGVLVAFTEGPEVALYAAIVYVVVQQLEGNVIMPIAQRWAVELPPAYGLISLVAFALLFGFLGIFFGSPLAVVAMTLVQNLYIKNGLEKEGSIPSSVDARSR